MNKINSFCCDHFYLDAHCNHKHENGNIIGQFSKLAIDFQSFRSLPFSCCSDPFFRSSHFFKFVLYVHVSPSSFQIQVLLHPNKRKKLLSPNLSLTHFLEHTNTHTHTNGLTPSISLIGK